MFTYQLTDVLQNYWVSIDSISPSKFRVLTLLSYMTYMLKNLKQHLNLSLWSLSLKEIQMKIE